MFGISSAPEKYQQIIQQLVTDIPGVHNISDDVIVHGANQEEHDQRLVKVLNRFQERGLTLNKEKCKFNMNELVFMGHVLTPKGIGPEGEKVKAVVNARRPESATEVRSFLGLVQFNGRYIQDLVTIAEPLKYLTKKAVPFVWTQKQEKIISDFEKQIS